MATPARPLAVLAAALLTLASCTVGPDYERPALEMPEGYSPQTWSQLEIGWTRLGIQVWCRRHELNILHMDFEGHKHPARTSGTGATVRTADAQE